MASDPNALDAALRKLRAEHQRNRYTDAADRERTQRLIADLERQLRHPDPQQTQDEICRRLGEAMEAFQVRHPQLTAALGQVIQLLSGMGV